MSIDHTIIVVLCLVCVGFCVKGVFRLPATNDPCEDCPQKGSIWKCHSTRCGVRKYWYAKTRVEDLETDRRRLREAVELYRLVSGQGRVTEVEQKKLHDALVASYLVDGPPDAMEIHKLSRQTTVSYASAEKQRRERNTP